MTLQPPPIKEVDKQHTVTNIRTEFVLDFTVSRSTLYWDTFQIESFN